MGPAAILSILVKTTGVQAAAAQMTALHRQMQKTSAEAAALGERMERSGVRASRMGRTMMASVTLPLLAVGGAAVKMSSDFEDSMAKIEGLVGISQTQVKAWSDDLLRLGPEVGKSPKELADALFFVTSAGFRGAAALDVLTISAKASSAGLGETQVVADAVTSAVNAYGAANLTASKSADILVATVREGKTAAASIAPVIGRLAPVAQAMGVSFDQVGASLASLTRVGLDAAGAATATRAILMTIAKPNKGVSESFKAIGTSVAEVRTEMREKGFLQTLMDLRKSAEANGVEFAKLFPNVRALTGFLALTGQSAGANVGIFHRLAESAGSVNKAFEVAQQTAGFKMKAALSELAVAAIRLGDILIPIVVPALQTFAHVIGVAGEAFASLPHGTQVAILGILGFLAAIGPLVFVIGGTYAALGVFVTMMGEAAVALLSMPGLLFALAAAFTIAYASSESFRRVVGQIGGVLATAAQDLVAGANAIIGVFGQMVAAVAQVPGQIAQVAANIGVSIVTGVLTGLSTLENAVVATVENALVGALTSLSPFSPVAEGGRKYIGAPLAQGALEGWVFGSAQLPAKMSQSIQNAVQRTKATVEASRSDFAAAFQRMAGDALSAFDAINANLKTPTEKLLARLTDEHDVAALGQAVTDAQKRVADAQAAVLTAGDDAIASAQKGLSSATASALHPDTGAAASPQELQAIKDAQQALADAQAAKPAAVAKAQADVLDAQRGLEDAQWAQQQRALTRKAEGERKGLDADIALKRRHFSDGLDDLQKSLAKEGATRLQAHAKIVKLMKSFGVDYHTAGMASGAAFAVGMKESERAVDASAENIHKIATSKLVVTAEDIAAAATTKVKTAKVPKVAKVGTPKTADLSKIKPPVVPDMPDVGGAVKKASTAKLAAEADKIVAPFRKAQAAASDTFGWISDHWQLLRGILGGPFAAAGDMIVTHLGAISGAAQTAMDAVVSAFNGAVSGVSSAMSAISGAVTGATGAISGAFATVKNAIVDEVSQWRVLWFVVNTAATIIKAVVGTIASSVIGAFAPIVSLMSGPVTLAWEAVKGAFSAGIAALGPIITAGVQALGAVWSSQLNILAVIARTVWGVVTSVFRGAWITISALVLGALQSLHGVIQVFGGIFKGDFGQIWEGIKNIFGGAIGAIKGLLLGAVTSFAGTARAIGSGLAGAFRTGWDTIKTIFSTGIGAAKKLLTDAVTTLGAAGTSIGKGIADGINNALSAAVDAVRGFILAIVKIVNKLPFVNISTKGLEAKDNVNKGPGNADLSQSTGKLARGGAFGMTAGYVNKPMVMMGEEAPRHPEYVIPTNPAYRGRAKGLLGQAAKAIGYAAGGVLSFDEIANTWTTAGGNAAKAETMAWIAEAESGGDLTINYGGGHNSPLGPQGKLASGLWQILGIPAGFDGNKIYTAIGNAQMAIAKSSNGANLGPWSSSEAVWGPHVKHNSGPLGSLSSVIGGVSGALGQLIKGGAQALIGKLPSAGDLPEWLKGTGEYVLDKAGGFIKDKINSLIGGGGGVVASGDAGGKLAAMVAQAASMAAQHQPYLYGGGHSSFAGPWDCSGAVSAVLHAAGLLGAPITTDGLKNFGNEGDGELVTIGVRGSTGQNAHTMIKLGNRYFESGGGHGAAWVGGWDGNFPIHRHPAGMARGGIVDQRATVMDPDAVGFPGWGLASGGTYSQADVDTLLARIAELRGNLDTATGAVGGGAQRLRDLGASFAQSQAKYKDLPFVGGFKDGGIVPRTGMGLLHAGETVIPMAMGGLSSHSVFNPNYHPALGLSSQSVFNPNYHFGVSTPGYTPPPSEPAPDPTPEDDTPYSQADIDALNASIQSLTDSIDAANRLTAAQNEKITELQRNVNVSQSQYGVLAKAIADVASGQIGGKVGLGFMSPGFSGGGSRY